MGIENILSVMPALLGGVGAIIAAIGAIASTSMVRRRTKAEEELAQKLVLILMKEHGVERFNTIRDQIAHGQNIDDALLRQYVVHVERALELVEDSNKTLVMKALDQPSENGRAAYFKKLIRETVPEVGHEQT